jgi:hypothetical protein
MLTSEKPCGLLVVVTYPPAFHRPLRFLFPPWPAHGVKIPLSPPLGFALEVGTCPKSERVASKIRGKAPKKKGGLHK